MAPVTRWLLVALAAEKVVQHAVVSWALASDRFGLRSAVAVDHRWLAGVGSVAGVLSAVALVGLLGRRRWSLVLLALLATLDIAGEFVAQGTIAIAITVSFVLAIVILILSLHELRREPVPSAGAVTGLRRQRPVRLADRARLW